MSTDGGQPQQKRRKWDVPANMPAAAPEGPPAPLSAPAPGGVDIAAAQAAAAAIFSKYHPGAQVRERRGTHLHLDSSDRGDIAAGMALWKPRRGNLRFFVCLSQAKGATPGSAPAVAAAAGTAGAGALELAREVVINDAPTGVRIHLTKRGVQDEIQSRTATIIVTRGRYYPPGVQPDGKEKPLHLLVRPGAHAGTVRTQLAVLGGGRPRGRQRHEASAAAGARARSVGVGAGHWALGAGHGPAVSNT